MAISSATGKKSIALLREEQVRLSPVFRLEFPIACALRARCGASSDAGPYACTVSVLREEQVRLSPVFRMEFPIACALRARCGASSDAGPYACAISVLL